MPSRSLDDLRPVFRPRVDDWLADCASNGLDILVYCTLRTDAEQENLYAQGRTLPGRILTNAKPGQSAHGYGLGLDHVPMLAGKPQWGAGNPLYVRSINIALSHGLESLNKSSFPEWAHLQMPDWRAYIDQRTA